MQEITDKSPIESENDLRKLGIKKCSLTDIHESWQYENWYSWLQFYIGPIKSHEWTKKTYLILIEGGIFVTFFCDLYISLIILDDKLCDYFKLKIEIYKENFKHYWKFNLMAVNWLNGYPISLLLFTPLKWKQCRSYALPFDVNPNIDESTDLLQFNKYADRKAFHHFDKVCLWTQYAWFLIFEICCNM